MPSFNEAATVRLRKYFYQISDCDGKRPFNEAATVRLRKLILGEFEYDYTHTPSMRPQPLGCGNIEADDRIHTKPNLQ